MSKSKKIFATGAQYYELLSARSKNATRFGYDTGSYKQVRWLASLMRDFDSDVSEPIFYCGGTDRSLEYYMQIPLTKRITSTLIAFFLAIENGELDTDFVHTPYFKPLLEGRLGPSQAKSMLDKGTPFEEWEKSNPFEEWQKSNPSHFEQTKVILSSHGLLQCPLPHCFDVDGESYLHQLSVDVYFRQEDTNCEGVHIDGDGTVSTPAKHPNPSARRDGIVISFECENCDGGKRMTITQHKGQTYIQWDFDTPVE